LNPISFPRPMVRRPNVEVTVELDLIRYFPDDKAINAALRTLIAEPT
jgi:hypothetical protein